MGGRIHGFLGGVLLVTSVAYYTSSEFKKNQEFVSKTLRDTDTIIHNLDRETRPIPREVEFQYRPSIKQTIADLWNEQILNGVKSIYSFNFEKTAVSLVESVQNTINQVK